MLLHVQRNREPKNGKPRLFEATFRLEMDEREQSTASEYCEVDHMICELTESMVGGPDMHELMAAGGLVLSKLREGVTLHHWIDGMLEDEKKIVQGCREFSAFMKAVASYPGKLEIEI